MNRRSTLTFKRLSAWMEVFFWDLAVLLLSRSKMIRVLVRAGYETIQHLRKTLEPTQLLIWGISGWSLGFLIGFLGSLLVR
jgi:hypothetical protein